MNSDFLVSIIVPIYNVEKYLDECLDSILKQSYKNLQIILVNDGSEDDSVTIAQKYVNLDNRFNLYSIHNQGVSNARNYGLDKTTGDFVCFIDSDDFISKNFISDFIEIISKSNACVVTCARFNVYNNYLEPVFISDIYSIWTGKEALINMLNWQYVDGSVCDKIFKKSYFNELRFKQGVISEDLPITAQIFVNSKYVIHTGKPNYYYRQREGSRSKQQYNKNLLSVLLSANDVYDIVSIHYPELKVLGKKFILHHILFLISLYFRSSYISHEDELSFVSVKKLFFKNILIYFLPNKRNIFKKILLFIVLLTNTQKYARIFYHKIKQK